MTARKTNASPKCALVVSCLVAIVATWPASGNQNKAKQTGRHPAGAAQNKAATPATSTYATSPFDVTVSVLPKGYRGHSLEAVVARLTPQGEKSEFETEAQYASRLPKPRPGDRWAFAMDAPWVTYDPEESEFTVHVFENTDLFLSSGMSIPARSVILREVLVGTRRYRATNAFGVMVEVQSRRIVRYALALHGPAPKADEPRYHNYIVPAAPAEAPVLKRRIGVLFICDPREDRTPPLVDTGQSVVEPTIAKPVETTIHYKYLDVTLQAVWVYDKTSGKVFVKDPLFLLGTVVR